MKAVPISLFLFCALILCIILNVAFLRSSADRLLEFADELCQSEERKDTLDELLEFWRARKDLIGLTISSGLLDRTEEILISLEHYAATGNEGEFCRYCALLKDAAHCIRRVEEFGLGNLF